MSEILRVDRVSFSYPGRAVVRDCSLSLSSGEIVALMGPSGCGKSTLLRLLGGLETPSSGSVVPDPALLSRGSGLGYLFQDHDAFPWLTVENNLREGSGMPPLPAHGEVLRLLAQLGLEGSAKLYPPQLSGGMKKRLGLGRVLVRRPRLLLLDEPFASLDLATRVEIYGLLHDFVRELKCAVLLVTHDLAEAAVLADRILTNSGPVLTLEGPGHTVPRQEGRPRGIGVLREPAIMALVQDLESALLGSRTAQRS